MTPSLPRRFTARALNLVELAALAPSDIKVCASVSREAYLSRFFTDGETQTLEAFLRTCHLSRAEFNRALSITRVEKDVIRAEWYCLLARVLQTEFLKENPDTEGFCPGLKAVLFPFMSWAQQAVADIFAGEWISAEVRTTLVADLSDSLFFIARKACVLEANILARKAKREDRPFQKAPMDQLFKAATEQSPLYVQKFYLRYAALSRDVAIRTQQWVCNVKRLFSRLEKDRSALGCFSPDISQSRLTGIKPTASDYHDGGQSVFILCFGDSHKIVYKPRSTQVDQAYYELLRTLHDKGLTPRHRLLKTLNRDDYGYVEFVESVPHVPDDVSVRDFYLRQGANLAILYVLNASDFHFENLIACHEHPVLIDLETVIHAQSSAGAEFRDNEPGDTNLRTSVFKTGLLPGWAPGKTDQFLPDITGFGGNPGQFYKKASDFMSWTAEGEIKVEKRRFPIEKGANLPEYKGEKLNSADFVEEIIEGFEQAYNILCGHADELLAPDGLIEQLSHAPLRFIILDTHTYMHLLVKSWHPDFQSRTLDRDFLFSHLTTRAPFKDGTDKVVYAEYLALNRGDIPKFTQASNNTILFDDRGHAIEGVILETPLETIFQNFAKLGSRDLEFQKRIIRLGLKTIQATQPRIIRSYTHHETQALSSDEVLQTCRKIADKICDEAILEKNRISWLTLMQITHGQSVVDHTGSDMYNGLAGIGLFLSHMATLADHTRYGDMAVLCRDRILRELEVDHGGFGGAFTGRVSAAYGLSHFPQALFDPDIERRIRNALTRIAGLIPGDDDFDIISGAAGFSAVCLSLYKRTQNPEYLRLAESGAEHLIKNAETIDGGLAWTTLDATAPLTGFSHGAAGIGWMLIHLGHVTKNQDWLGAGLSAFKYEDQSYDPAHNGWPDFRHEMDRGSENPFNCFWCHGSMGIALSRITVPSDYQDEDFKTRLGPLLSDLINGPMATNDSLCHGEAGNVELITSASINFNKPEWLEQAKKRVSAVIRAEQGRGCFLGGEHHNYMSPGLMTGLAGIGYGCLRPYWPDRLPNILAVE